MCVLRVRTRRAPQPLLGKISKHLVSHGGSAVLAETDELIGGETYVVENSRDFATAQAFVDMVCRLLENILVDALPRASTRFVPKARYAPKRFGVPSV